MFVPAIEAALVAWLAAPSANQEPRVQELSVRPGLAGICELLESDDPRRIAWGVHHARGSDVVRVVPSLMVALSRLRHAEPGEGWEAASLQVLDLLREARVALVPDELTAFVEESGTRKLALGLLAAVEEPDETFFRTLYEQATRCDEEAEVLLAGNVLASIRAPGFARMLLERLEFRGVVRLDRTRQVGRCGGMFSGHIEALLPEIPERYPAIPHVDWCAPEARNAWLLPGRNRRLALSRELVTTGDLGLEAPPPEFERLPLFVHVDMLDWCADLLRCPRADLDVALISVEEHVQTDPESLRPPLARVQARAERERDRLAERFAKLGLLSPAERRAPLPPALLEVVDESRIFLRRRDVPAGVRIR